MPIMHYYIVHQLPDGTTTYLSEIGEFKHELVVGRDFTLVFDNADTALVLAVEHDALVLVVTDDGWKTI